MPRNGDSIKPALYLDDLRRLCLRAHDNCRYTVFTISSDQPMTASTKSSTLRAILRSALSPRPQEKSSPTRFSRSLQDVQRCSGCDLKFQREEGYFWAPCTSSLALALAISPVIAHCVCYTCWWITKDVICSVVLFRPAPGISLFSRVRGSI